MEQEVREVNGYVQCTDGKWYLTEASKAESLAMYYRGRLAYDRVDPRKVIGTYSPTGEVIPFPVRPGKNTTSTEE